jgi:hypothetical protein
LYPSQCLDTGRRYFFRLRQGVAGFAVHADLHNCRIMLTLPVIPQTDTGCFGFQFQNGVIRGT